MDVVVLTARMLLALVLAVAGVAKMLAPEGARTSLTEFGVPARFAIWLAWLLPALEVLVALALIPVNAAWFGGFGALILFAIFTAAISVKLARGESVDCHCFGKLESGPIGWKTLARNVALTAMASIVVISGPGMSAVDWLGELSSIEIAAVVAGAVALMLLSAAVAFVIKVLRQLTSLQESVDLIKRAIDEDYAEARPVEHEQALAPAAGLAVGVPAPKFSLEAMDGQFVGIDDLLVPGKALLLLFVSAHCPSCQLVLNAIERWEREFGDNLTIAALVKGGVRENRSWVAKYRARHLLVQGNGAIAREYKAQWTPAGVLIGPEGRIASPVTYGEEAIRTLIAETFYTLGHDGFNAFPKELELGFSKLKVGDRVPPFALPDFEGRLVSSDDLLGSATLLVFWDPACPFCSEIADEIRRLEKSPPGDAPRLVLIVSRSDDEVEMSGKDFRSMMLLDPAFELAPLFGSASTPSAVLIDEVGRIGSGIAYSGANVLALAGLRQSQWPTTRLEGDRAVS